MSDNIQELLKDVRNCDICAAHLPMGPRPVVSIHPDATILIAGQAPGVRVHNTGIPFNDPSGDRLREWMAIDSDTFYDEKEIAIIPMGFCYPGTGKSGDLPPRKECAEKWRNPLLDILPNIKLTLVIGQYAHAWHLKGRQKKNLTETVKAWREYEGDGVLPLPHPSPRNNIWLKKNPWFDAEVLPALREKIAAYL